MCMSAGLGRRVVRLEERAGLGAGPYCRCGPSIRVLGDGEEPPVEDGDVCLVCGRPVCVVVRVVGAVDLAAL